MINPIPGTLHVGFTGTELGMTEPQRKQLDKILWRINEIQGGIVASHHGCCIGADEEFHDATRIYREGWDRYIHPPINEKKMADIEGGISFPPADYLARDEIIAIKSHLLIAAPSNYQEITGRGRDAGVWYTVRQARKLHKPIIILWPAWDSYI